MRIIFLGTPDFAVASLKAMVESGKQVVAVVTAPDRPAGRGMELQASAVKKYAQQAGLPVLQPVKLKDPAFLEELQSFRADLQVVVAFRMLPEAVWNMPPLGTVNVHASLLPRYRGAAPINWAIINGEKETGVTTFRLRHAIDTGEILLQRALPIGAEETAGELHDRLMQAGAEVLLETLDALEAGTLQARPQPVQGDWPHAPKIFTADCRIQWNEPASKIHNLIRGMSPYPGAFTTFGGKQLKIYRSLPMPGRDHTAPGTLGIGSESLTVQCGEGTLSLLELQLEGKKRLRVADFVRGLRADEGTLRLL
jgi:methionyl-tRNA formyltransferase